ncbi:hypothetical protein Tco_1101153 [Tanacetum coccineum]
MPTTTATVTETTTTTVVPPPPPQPQRLNLDLNSDDWSAGTKYSRSGGCKSSPGGKARQAREQDPPIGDSRLHAMRAPLRARFKDLLTSDMKEILLQRMLEENYDKSHEDHKMAFEALQKSIICDESEQFDADKAKERTKKKSKQDSLKTPPGSPPPPPPPLPPSGASRAFGPTRTSDSAQDPPPPPPSLTTNRDVLMLEESDFEAQDMGSNDEDSGSRHIPNLPVPNNNWASAIASSFVSLSENSLLSQIGDIRVFIDWLCKKQGIIELTPKHLEGHAYEVVKAFHPDMIHL